MEFIQTIHSRIAIRAKNGNFSFFPSFFNVFDLWTAVTLSVWDIPRNICSCCFVYEPIYCHSLTCVVASTRAKWTNKDLVTFAPGLAHPSYCSLTAHSFSMGCPVCAKGFKWGTTEECNREELKALSTGDYRHFFTRLVYLLSGIFSLSAKLSWKTLPRVAYSMENVHGGTFGDFWSCFSNTLTYNLRKVSFSSASAFPACLLALVESTSQFCLRLRPAQHIVETGACWLLCKQKSFNL